MDNPHISNIKPSKVITWGVDIPVNDQEKIRQVINRDCPEGAALFNTMKPVDKNWKVRLYLRIEETDK